MMRFYRNDQNGRSMVEMLGVLAIIGVLSVGGIAGYSKAMTKFKINKSMDQISMLVANIRTLYSGQRNYSGLDNKNAILFGIIPNEMGNSGSVITNAFAGDVEIKTAAVGTNAAGAFTIKYKGLGQEACVTMATADWGSGSSSGLVQMNVGNTDADGAKFEGTTGDSALPVSLTNAATNCDCATAVCSIKWTYL